MFKEKMSILCHFFKKKKNSAETCSTQKQNNNTAEQGLSQASNTIYILNG